MGIIKRFFIVIWVIVFIALSFGGGFVVFPIIRYIATGKLDDPVEASFNVCDKGIEMIESFFNGIKIGNYNEKFWK